MHRPAGGPTTHGSRKNGLRREVDRQGWTVLYGAAAGRAWSRTRWRAALNGPRQIYTWTQVGNTSMLRLNEHLGYVTTRNAVL